MKNNQDEGFTLVELLIVIVILGILATVTVFAVRGITDSGRDNACAVERRTIDVAVEAYNASNQVDAGSINDLVPGFLMTDPTVGATATFSLTFTADGSVPPVVAGINDCVGF